MFEPENDLERSLEKAMKNPEDRSQFYCELLVAEILAISSGTPAQTSKSEVLARGTEVHFQHFEYQGTRYLPIFSSTKRLQQATKTPTTYIKLKARDFFELTLGERIFLNPGSEVAKGFTPKEVSDLLDGTIFQPRERFKLDEETEVLVGQPSDYPEPVVTALIAQFGKNQLVRSAYLVLVGSSTTEDKPRYIIGIDVEGDWETVLEEAKQVLPQQETQKATFELIPIDTSPVSRYMITQTEAFYRRDQELGRIG
jgi:hypothetical protein